MSDLATQQLSQEVLSSLVLNGDVSKLNATQKMQVYGELCRRVGIDSSTQPFKLLKLNGKEVFYADKGATQQLSQKHNISHEIVKRERVEDVYVVTVRAKLPDGRFTDEDGAVTIGSDKGDKLANSLMKATTKAKRRAVLALLGLGMMDESEIETIPNAVPVEMHKVETPSVQDAVVVEEKNDKQRSQEYYISRDGLDALENNDSATIKDLERLKMQMDAFKIEKKITDKEYADLYEKSKKIYNKKFKTK
jgi:hypothetical protein